MSDNRNTLYFTKEIEKIVDEIEEQHEVLLQAVDEQRELSSYPPKDSDYPELREVTKAFRGAVATFDSALYLVRRGAMRTLLDEAREMEEEFFESQRRTQAERLAIIRDGTVGDENPDGTAP